MKVPSLPKLSIPLKSNFLKPQRTYFSGIHMSLNGNTLELVAMDVNFSMKKVLEVNGNEDGVILVPAQSLGDLWPSFLRTFSR